MLALMLIIRWRDYTILRNLDQSTALTTAGINAFMGAIAALLTQTKSSLYQGLMVLSIMTGSTFIYLKLFGVHLIIATIRPTACTRITGKILEGGRAYLDM
jgi:hypothetical protein